MFDSSATPRSGERVATPTGFASVDLDRLRTRLAASGGTAPDAPPGTAAELARLRAELWVALDRPPRVEYVEVLSAGLAQLLREPVHQLHSLGCTPRRPAARGGLQCVAQADPGFDVAAPRGHPLATRSRRSGRSGEVS